jgi:ribosome-binding protein aMBF1 (putative translation factor)
MAKKKVNSKPEKKRRSPGSLSPAVPDDRATEKLQKAVGDAVKRTGWSGSRLHKETGISLAMCRRMVRGDKTDMKVSTLARLLECKGIGLKITTA